MRQAVTNEGGGFVWRTATIATNIVYILLNDNGQISAYNNLVVDNLQAYSANIWYKLDIKITSFTNKTYQVRVDDGSWSADKTFYNNNAAANLDGLFITQGGTGAKYWDTIGPAAESEGGDVSVNVEIGTSTVSQIARIGFEGFILFLISGIFTFLLMMLIL